MLTQCWPLYVLRHTMRLAGMICKGQYGGPTSTHLGRVVGLGMLVAQRPQAVQGEDLAVRRIRHLGQPLVGPRAVHNLQGAGSSREG